ncbi:bifunctional phosphoribosylaminoimidazolecarboxamide formyltransferase/IMP cyclohydrolase [Armatimonas sp.]|uniref:bifunctional phosphoribosylaminoimidazolecarboxamide formyltransferase/IMP cyclohydrolase n=1 Tax=Armatimonas sp. TaxID=1872638 RepID=UPI0037501CDB
MEYIKIKRALLSVSDKTGIVELAQALAGRGVELVSTGGTAKALKDAGLAVRAIDELTGFPEMLEGRVKTLHPNVHGGILADRDKPEHLATIAEHGIGPIDLVVVNLYPFAKTIANPDVTLEDAIENIDIGGPAMVRSAAKNHQGVAIVVDPADYAQLLTENDGDGVSLAFRRKLMARAYAHTAAYDSLIASYFEKQFAPPAPASGGVVLPKTLRLSFEKVQDLRYGENPHQVAGFYKSPPASGGGGGTEACIGNATRRDDSGKEVSFNNLYDLDGALELVKEFPDAPTAAIIKHANPCGCAQGETIAEAFVRAREADTISAFGGILAINRKFDLALAEQIIGLNNFLECIVAPDYDEAAIKKVVGGKKWGANLRLLQVAGIAGPGSAGYLLKQVVGGMLVSTRDFRPLTDDDLTVKSERQPTADELSELLFAWRCVKHTKSNAIVITQGRALRGVGAGQMNRVRSVRLAVEQAGELAKGAVLASDAFFPFPDGPEVAAKAGVTAIIQPGGSVKDSETIALCNQYNIALVFTGVRHFRH